jgi:endonuclease YncB( thermonuclease family)
MIRALLIALTLTGPASVETVHGRRIVIIDGDTIAVGHERIRIENIDTRETFRSRCEAELVLGLKAKQRLAELLRTRAIVITRMGEDRYRRTLARLSAGGRDVGEVLVQEGFALPWKDEPAARAARLQHWCGGRA